MRKTLLFLLALAILSASAFWAYRVNYATQDAVRRVAALHAQIAREREALAVLRAEWAYLNAPDRLRRLADAHFDRLGLMPITPAHFESPEKIAYPPLRVTVVVDGEEHIVSVLDHEKMGVPTPALRPGEDYEAAPEVEPEGLPQVEPTPPEGESEAIAAAVAQVVGEGEE